MEPRRRWETLRDEFLAGHPPPMVDERETASEDDDAWPEAQCRERVVGDVIIGTCGLGTIHGYEDFAGWIISQEGVLDLAERETIAGVDNGDILYEVARPRLAPDPREGLAILSHVANPMLGVVSIGPEGPEYVEVASPGAAQIAPTMCGDALVTMPVEDATPLRVVATRQADGSIRDGSACATALDAIAARVQASSLAARAALIDGVRARAPTTEPACSPPAEREVTRAHRLLLDALAEDLSEADGEDVDEGTRRSQIEAILATATPGCIDRATGSFFLTLGSTEFPYAAVWEVRRREAIEVMVVRPGHADGGTVAFEVVSSVDFFGNGAPALVVRTVQEGEDGEGGWSCEATYRVLMLGHERPLLERRTGCGPTAESPVPFAVIAGSPGVPTAILLDGVWTWGGAELVVATEQYRELSGLITAWAERRAALTEVRTQITTRGPEDAWSEAMGAGLARAGVPTPEARALVAAVLASRE